MKLKPTSFRSKIILTLIVVTAVFSFASFQIYSNYLSRKIYNNAEDNIKTLLYFLRDEIINIHDGRLIKPLLKNMGKDKRIMRAYLLDGNGKMVFTDVAKEQKIDTSDFTHFINAKEDISVKSYPRGRNPYSRAFLHVYNGPTCYECHPPAQETLGYVVLDLSMKETKSTLAYTRNFSILFTAFMVLIILFFVLIMHYRFVRKSLSSFQHVIQTINEGDLNERVLISESSELGQLGKCFNTMLDNFQRTQQELFAYHKKELQNAEKLAAIGEMSARLAHDVRNPLTGIANSIEIIAGDMQDSPHLPILGEIQRQANRVNVAISNLLKYSRSSEISLNAGNINELVHSLVFFLKSQKQNRQVEFEFIEDSAISEFRFDAEQVENVLMNLGLNALQAMHNTGHIIFRTSLDKNGEVIVSVSDNGPGISSDIESQIFKPFYTTRTEGTGLGLAIAKDIVEKHGGRIWYEANPEGGTIFYISLPVIEV